MSYLVAGALVLGAAGAAGAALVLVLLELSDPLQPASTPAVRPNSTIRVNSLFIVGVSFTKRSKRTSKKDYFF
jgi:hypothetical protein